MTTTQQIEQIERLVESRTDDLDRAYLNSPMTEAEYKEALARLDAWAEAAYGRIARA